MSLGRRSCSVASGVPAGTIPGASHCRAWCPLQGSRAAARRQLAGREQAEERSSSSAQCPPGEQAGSGQLSLRSHSGHTRGQDGVWVGKLPPGVSCLCCVLQPGLLSFKVL